MATPNGTNIKVLVAALHAKLRRLGGKPRDPYLPLPEGPLLSPSLGVAVARREAPRRLGCDKAQADTPEAWQNAARAKLMELTGYHAERATPDVTLAQPVTDIGDGLVRHTFYLRVRPDTDVPVHLVYGKDLKEFAPVFLHLAGSTSGVHLAWGDARVPIDHDRLARGADMARQAAARGYLAVAIEQAGYGERLERVLPKRSKSRTIDLANHLLLLGRTLMGDGASDVSSVIDWLAGGHAPITIDANRVFLFGHSAGGTLAQYTAALDTRIAGVLASGSVGLMNDTIAARGAGTGDGIVPQFLNWFESSDLIALVAPRPFVALNGDRDHIFPHDGARKAIEGARPIYAKMGAIDALQAVGAEGTHGYFGRETWDAWERYIVPPERKTRA